MINVFEQRVFVGLLHKYNDISGLSCYVIVIPSVCGNAFPPALFHESLLRRGGRDSHNRTSECFGPSGGTQSVTNMSLRHNTRPEILISQAVTVLI
jgi:hypothetical protein